MKIPKDLRFTCRACGSCCVGTNIGPVSREVVKGLRGDIARELKAEIGWDGPLFYLIDYLEGEILMCQIKNGACIFLGENGGCLIHRKYGSEKKPEVCRLFPYRPIKTPLGLYIGLNTECREILDASNGEEISAEHIKGLLPFFERYIRKIPDRCKMFGEEEVTFEQYQTLEDNILQYCDSLNWIELQGRVIDLIKGWLALKGIGWEQEGGGIDALFGFLNKLENELIRLCKTIKAEDGVRPIILDIEPVYKAISLASEILAQALDFKVQRRVARFADIHFRAWWRGKDCLLYPDIVSGAGVFPLKWILISLCATAKAQSLLRNLPTERDFLDAGVLVSGLIRNQKIINLLGLLKDDISQVFMFDFGWSRMFQEIIS